MTVNLLDLDGEQLAGFVAGLGEKPFRARQLKRWMHRFGESDFARMSDLAKSLREKLARTASVSPPRIVNDSIAGDGTRKWLLDVGKGNAIEAVFIPETNRGTLCISTQAGCTLACRFCSTGRQGFNRNLSVAEIIGQLWLANRELGATPGGERVISNVVLMGMGEPLLNFDNTVSALKLMLDDDAYGLSRRRVTLSTSGIVPMIDRLGAECPVALAVSLHAPNDALRDTLMPINRKYPLAELLAACRRYLERAPRDFITFEYIMLEGVNDAEEHARQLIDLVSRVPCKINLIPFNPFPNSGFVRSPRRVIERFSEVLSASGIVTTTRKTRGDEIDAACGQLAGAYYQRGNLGVALAEARTAVAADSGYAPAYNVLGLVYGDLREKDLAEEALQRSLRMNPNDPDANHNYAWFLCENKREEESIRYFLMAVRHPLYATPQKSYAMAAVCAMRKNNERDAHDYLERALKLDPNYYPALIDLAQLKYRRGELDAARSLTGRYNKLAEPTAESLWLALRIERRLGDSSTVTNYANQLRRRFPGSKEYQELQKGRFE